MSEDNGDEDIGDVDMNQEHSTNKVPGGQHKLRKLDDHLDSSSSVNKYWYSRNVLKLVLN